MGGLWQLVLRSASTLDAFRSYQRGAWLPSDACTTGVPVAPEPRSSRTKGSLLSIAYTSRRYYRTVSRRTEPSSCGILMDEQPNPWRLLHRQDIPSRQRCTKPRGRFILNRPTDRLIFLLIISIISILLVRALEGDARKMKRRPFGRVHKKKGILGAPLIHVYSRPRRACYPRGSLSDSLNSHQQNIKVR